MLLVQLAPGQVRDVARLRYFLERLPTWMRVAVELRHQSFVYVRLHGPSREHLYAGSYSDADLAWWRDRVWEWQAAGVRNAAALRHGLAVPA